MLVHRERSFIVPNKKPGANTGRVMNLLLDNFINMGSVVGDGSQKEDAR